jgi:DNA adenine methylase
VVKAARLIYLNKTCYNGLYRVNRSGHFNVPVGNYRDPLICDELTLRAIHRYLNQHQITILHADYHAALTNVPPGSLVYFDPPYHSPAKRNFTSYHADGFGEADQIALAAACHTLSQQGVYCLLSNADPLDARALCRLHDYPLPPPTGRLIHNTPDEDESTKS